MVESGRVVVMSNSWCDKLDEVSNGGQGCVSVRCVFVGKVRIVGTVLG